jgi:fructoselysine-6-P-deglycase FrlB-like protein
MSSATENELRSQPETWARALDLLGGVQDSLPRQGESVLVVGCGTSWFIAMAYAKLREAAGEGLTDAATATEAPLGRSYDRVLALTRSGTTTEIVDLLKATEIPSTLVTAVADGPATPHATAEIVLDFADETSVVQTRFATTTLALLRASLGEDLSAAIADARAVLAQEPPASWIDADQISFLGTGWTKGLAEQTRRTGAEFVTSDADPLAQLVGAQLWAVRRAESRGLNPDTPRSLTRAVHLETA